MTPYLVNPYVSFIESRLFPDSIQYAVFHRLTNEIVEPGETVRSLLQAAKLGNGISLSDAQLGQLGETGEVLKRLGDAWNRRRLTPRTKGFLTRLLSWRR